MPFLRGPIIDASNGLPMAAVVHILDGGGRPVVPAGAVRKVGPGLTGFYADGEFMVELSGGLTTVQVERGTEFLPFTWIGQVPWSGITELPVALTRWTHLPDRGWFPGNTHVHYDEHEANPDARLRLDPQVHDLHVTVISILQRGDFAYASNRYPVGLLTDLSSAHHVVDCGEECRHNSEPWTIGYGHVLFLRLQEPVLPISRGLLVDQTDPDYPPLCYACDEARRQGGIAIWCHNGDGMEAPVAAVLGKLDAFNLFDPYQVLPEEYGIWYRMLNCGLHLPASTGSDWYICSNNRVYVRIEGVFSYAAWLAGLAGGRSFITNGPALYLRVNGADPGDNLPLSPGASVEAEITWESPYPIENIELIQDGQVIVSQRWARRRPERFSAHPRNGIRGRLAGRAPVGKHARFVLAAGLCPHQPDLGDQRRDRYEGGRCGALVRAGA